jgi:hypothetical protein
VLYRPSSTFCRTRSSRLLGIVTFIESLLRAATAAA